MSDMVNKEIIPHLKSCCLALGLTKKDDPQPFAVVGSGFIIDPDGFFVTADHVVDAMEDIRGAYIKNGVQLEYRGFLFQNIDDEHGDLVSIKIEHGRSFQLNIPELREYIPEDQDLHVGRLSGKNQLPHLKFDKSIAIEIFDEIFMCGYPGGSHSLRTEDQFYGNRFSPVLQYGRIASLLPSDYSKNPFGIQTDIIGTGGSSGSPIIDAETEQVLGIAQKVIPADVSVTVKSENATAKIGLVWGISNYFFASSMMKMVEELKKEFDKNGRPLPSDQLPHAIHLTDTFYPEKF